MGFLDGFRVTLKEFLTGKTITTMYPQEKRPKPPRSPFHVGEAHSTVLSSRRPAADDSTEPAPAEPNWVRNGSMSPIRSKLPEPAEN